MVTIDLLESEYRQLAGVVRDLERSNSEEKVSINAPCRIDTLGLKDCKRCSELYALVMKNNDPNLLALFQQLPTFSHLNTLLLRMEHWDSAICSLVAEYIATTSTLQRLRMQFYRSFVPPESDTWWRALSESLVLNRSITELGIGVSADVRLREDDMFLANAVMQGGLIRKICLLAWSRIAFRYFTRRLRANISKNRTLCSVTGWNGHELADDWFAVSDTARRNSGFVARAAQFLNHARCDRLCAAGLDRVSRHPALVAELAEVLSIDKVEAADMVRQRFQCIEGLDEFMRLAGVVKERVTCLPRQDGRTQLDGLNQDCWAHVRRYLELDDVAYGAAPHR
ncbi:hypothetical protein HPB49_006768 [Dermacentor silvarum]|uniref:Uncharacterized protein n=1 Tax=Dermacentor silvarum TaxID=543639 RepID=A0ACB8DVZ7_DERSI|nr:hypothetical protein HPB49_006768 [Dermacentor silvarum]